MRLRAQLYGQIHSALARRPRVFLPFRGPLYHNPPMKLNFFELLRASLGDSQFSDLWLVPEAPHFHQKAGHREVFLGLMRRWGSTE